MTALPLSHRLERALDGLLAGIVALVKASVKERFEAALPAG